MQPIGNRLVPSMLAAAANRKKALVRIFCENELCNSNVLIIPPALLFLLHSSTALINHRCRRLALIN